MIGNYVKIAWRNFLKNPFFSFIYVLGLTIGLTAGFVILTIVRYEFSFDDFHKNGERIYRLASGTEDKINADDATGFVPYAVPEAIRTEISGIEKVTAFINFTSDVKLVNEDGSIKNFPANEGQNTSIVLADNQYFDLFKYEWLAGSEDNALNQPSQVVLTLSQASRYFGAKAPHEYLNKTLIYGDSLLMTVSGIVKDFVRPSDLVFTDFISMATVKSETFFSYINPNEWNDLWSASQCFVQLEAEVSAEEIDTKLAAFYSIHKSKGLFVQPFLQKLSDIHFRFGDNYIKKVNKNQLYLLLIAAIFLLFLAIFNFINLSTAQASLKTKERGVQVILGSTRSQLFYKRVVESFFYTGVSAFFAVLLSPLCLKFYSAYLVHTISFSFNLQTILLVIGLTVLVSIIAAIVPTFIGGRLETGESLRQSIQMPKGKIAYRKGMITSQFALTMLFIFSSVFLTRQLSYMSNKDLGLDARNVYSMRLPRLEDIRKDLLLSEVKKLKGVKDASLQLFDPIGENFGVDEIVDAANPTEKIKIAYKNGDANFINFYKMKILAGRAIMSETSTDEMVITRELVRTLGLQNPEEAIGRNFIYQNQTFNCVGVVEDFHQQGMQSAIPPTIITIQKGNSLAIRFDDDHKIDEVKYQLETELASLLPADFVLSPTSLTENIAGFYDVENKMSNLLILAAILATLISCIGLNGLFVLIVAHRGKEIAVRKVLGAGIYKITYLLTRDIVYMMGFAFVLSMPLAWYLLDNWLNNFSYHIEINWLLFVIVAIALTIMSVISVAAQSLPATLKNPADMLRKE